MDKVLAEAVRRGIEARRSNPSYYDEEASKRKRVRDTSGDPVVTATPMPGHGQWSARRSNPSPAKTDREKRARLPLAPQLDPVGTQQAGHWETFDIETGKYLGSLSLVQLRTF